MLIHIFTSFKRRLFNSLCNGSIDVGNNNLVVVPPSENVTFTPCGALVRRSHAEHHFIHTFTEIQVFLKTIWHIADQNQSKTLKWNGWQGINSFL